MNFTKDVPKPRISIITINFNNGINLEETIKSVISQEYQQIEFLVIDGNSSDRSLEILKRYSDRITTIISEDDSGIYDAMNKGISLMSGEWGIFLNSGDIFENPNVLEKVFSNQKNLSFDIIYGNSYAFDHSNNIGRVFKSKSPKKLHTSMPFSHQSVFVKSNLLQRNHFDLRYYIVSDYHMFLKLYRWGYSFYKLDQTISAIDINGISYSNVNTLREQCAAYRDVYGFNIYLFINYIKWLVFEVRYVMSLLLGKKGVLMMRKIKWLLLKRFNGE